jgi:hypothetical protein
MAPSAGGVCRPFSSKRLLFAAGSAAGSPSLSSGVERFFVAAPVTTDVGVGALLPVSSGDGLGLGPK